MLHYSTSVVTCPADLLNSGTGVVLVRVASPRDDVDNQGERSSAIPRNPGSRNSTLFQGSSGGGGGGGVGWGGRGVSALMLPSSC